MKLSKIMSQDLITVHMDDSFGKIKQLFQDHNVHHLLVVDNKKLMGVISDRDLLFALPPNIDSISATTKDLASLDKKCHQIMTHNILQLSPDSTLVEAIKMFNKNKISCIPITDHKKTPLGIITWRDIMLQIEKRITE